MQLAITLLADALKILQFAHWYSQVYLCIKISSRS